MRLIFGVAAFLILASGCQSPAPSAAPLPPARAQVSASVARVVAVGIPGAGAISPVGAFHPGGPLHDSPTFAPMTRPDSILDAERIIVTSTSNFGAPKANAAQAEGSALSIDPRDQQPLVVPPDFAAAGGQARALDGKVQVFTAQSPPFVNSLTTPDAVTADEAGVSSPRGISINNAFGRVWFANVPTALASNGSETIIDPDGRPLAGAPSKVAGGVFAGTATNRVNQRVPGGISAGGVGNAFLGRSPDGTNKAVFAVVAADGSVTQVHSQAGVDGLAPTNTIRPLVASGPSRVGVAFNWTPDRILYITDPSANALVALTLTDDGDVFHAGAPRAITAPELAAPVDLSATLHEVANPDFSSNSTLAGGSDLYVANRGNGTVVRLRQDGTVTGVRRVQLPGGGTLGPNLLNGIAVSADGGRIWLTLDGALPGYEHSPGAVLEIAAFGAAGAN